MVDGTGTLRDLADAHDAERFVGRDDLRDAVRDATAGRSPHRVLYVHGPGGVGKSAALRTLARDAAADGTPVVSLDGRRLDPADPWSIRPGGPGGPGGPGAAPVAGTLVLVDELDALGDGRLTLRDALVTTLGSSCVVVLAGRNAPGPAWFADGLEHLTMPWQLPPLDDADVAELARRSGLVGPEVDRLVLRSRGYPLAVVLAAVLHAGDPGTGRPLAGPPDDPIGELVLERLGGTELDPVDPAVLEVAAVAPTVDPRLLAAALPGRRTRDAMAELRTTSVTDSVGNRVTLHPLLRDAVRSRLAATDADRLRTLVLRVAAHLRSRALTEDVRLALELAELVEDPDIRLGWAVSRTHEADRLRAGDVASMVAATDGSPWQARLQRWAEEAPDCVLVVRSSDGRPAAAAVVNRGDRLPPWAEDDADLGPMVAHARDLGRLERASFLHKLVLLGDTPPDPATLAEIIRVGNSGSVARGLTGNARYGYTTDVVRRPDDGTDVLGYSRVPELDRTDGPLELFTLVTDFGPDGVVGALDALIRVEQGELDPEAGGDGSVGRGADLILALRSFHDDAALGALALGGDAIDASARAAAARDELRRAIDAAFDASTEDRTLRLALERTYLDPDGGHARARQELHMSRSSFFRHLARARDRVADC